MPIDSHIPVHALTTCLVPRSILGCHEDLRIKIYATENFAFNAFTIAMTSLLVYDHMLTFHEEVSTVWHGHWGLVNVLFLFNRYVQPIDLIILCLSYASPSFPSSFCLKWWYIDTWESAVVELTVSVILYLRTIALYGRTKSAIIGLTVLLVLSMGVLLFGVFWATFHVFPVPGDTIRICTEGLNQVQVLDTIWLAILIWDTTLILLLFARLWPSIRSKTPTTPLVSIIFADGYVFFIGISVSSIANIITIKLAPPTISTLFFTFHRAISVILSSRMILHLRSTLLYKGGAYFSSNAMEPIRYAKRTNTQQASADVGDNIELESFDGVGVKRIQG